MTPKRLIFFLALPGLFFLCGREGSAQQADVLTHMEHEIAAEQDKSEELKQKAEKMAQEAKAVRQNMIAAARIIQDYETSLSTLEEELEQLMERQRTLEEDIRRKDVQMVRIMALLQSLSRRQEELVFLQPGDPLDVLRTGLLLRTTLPQISRTVEGMKADFAELEQLKTAIQRRVSEIRVASVKLEDKTRYMDQLVRQKTSLQARFEQESKDASARVAELGAKAQSLKELFQRLEEEKRRKEAEEARRRARLPRFPARPPVRTDDGASFARKGKLTLPIRGQIVKKYGESTDGGLYSRGMTFRSRASAHIIAPYDGTVIFAGPFRDYGQVIIIEHAENYHTLLAGMERIDIIVGQGLLAGEPVGVMPDRGMPLLYFELRRKGAPVDPFPWLAVNQ